MDSKNNLKGVIVVRDYAYPSSFLPSTPLPRPASEIFNQYEGLAEVEYRWTQSPRMYPVPGRILSRLLDIGWITEEEVLTRAAPMDLEELKKHSARLPVYPWKPVHSTTIPTNEERKELMLTRAQYFQQRDAARAMAEFKEMSRKNNPGLHNVKKRRAEEDSKTHSGTNWKKRGNLITQPKQYPAPLHAYDPNIYPEVAFPTESAASSNPPSRRLTRQSTEWIFPCDNEKGNNN